VINTWYISDKSDLHQ